MLGRHDQQTMTSRADSVTKCAHPIRVRQGGSHAAFPGSQVDGIEIPEGCIKERSAREIISVTADTLCLNPMLAARDRFRIGWDGDILHLNVICFVQH